MKSKSNIVINVAWGVNSVRPKRHTAFESYAGVESFVKGCFLDPTVMAVNVYPTAHKNIPTGKEFTSARSVIKNPEFNDEEFSIILDFGSETNRMETLNMALSALHSFSLDKIEDESPMIMVARKIPKKD